MTENQSNSNITNQVKQQDNPLQNTQDPLPWLIRSLRSKHQPRSGDPERLEASPEDEK